MKAIRSMSALGAVFFVSVGLAACGGGIPSDAVVQVNGTPITKSTFEHWLSIAASSNAATVPGQKTPKPVIPDPPAYKACIAHLEATAPKPAKGQSKPSEKTLKTECEQQYTALKNEVLGFLIQASWLAGEAKEQGVKVSDSEVQKQFDTLKKQQFPKEENFQKFLASTGQTVSDLLLRVKLNMLSQKIEQKVTKKAKSPVSESEVNKYYSEHKSQYGTPEKANLSIVLTKGEEAAKKAKSEIEAGASFATVAKKVSIDPVSKANGGKLTGIAKGQEEAALDKAIFAAKIGALEGPVKTPFGYYVFKVEKRSPATQQSLNQVKSTIKQTVAATRQQKSLSSFIKEFEKSWKGKTECRGEYVVADCKEYKAPKTSATPTTPQTSTGTTVTATVSTSKTK
jgi:parvulin-like peptidyl-prolyl isomerase